VIAIRRIATGVIRGVVCLSVTQCNSAGTVGRNEVPHGRDTCAVPSN